MQSQCYTHLKAAGVATHRWPVPWPFLLILSLCVVTAQGMTNAQIKDLR